MSPEKYLTDRQLATRYGVGRATIWRWAWESDRKGAAA
jgi:predicted DNA-binding transcriptional regulator AlpA